jgi:hypothetical protein
MWAVHYAVFPLGLASAMSCEITQLKSWGEPFMSTQGVMTPDMLRGTWRVELGGGMNIGWLLIKNLSNSSDGLVPR